MVKNRNRNTNDYVCNQITIFYILLFTAQTVLNIVENWCMVWTSKTLYKNKIWKHFCSFIVEMQASSIGLENKILQNIGKLIFRRFFFSMHSYSRCKALLLHNTILIYSIAKRRTGTLLLYFSEKKNAQSNTVTIYLKCNTLCLSGTRALNFRKMLPMYIKERWSKLAQTQFIC